MAAKKKAQKKASSRRPAAKQEPQRQQRRSQRQDNTPVSFFQGNNGWLVRTLNHDVRQGDHVYVAKKDGTETEVSITRVVGEGVFQDGTEWQLCAFQPVINPQSRSGRGGVRRQDRDLEDEIPF